MVGGLKMDTVELTRWAQVNADGPVVIRSDRSMSLNNKLVRFRWKDGLAIGVGSDAAGKVRINSVLDGISWFISTAQPSDTTLHIILGNGAPGTNASLSKENLGAIGTLVSELGDGPTVKLWVIDLGGNPQSLVVEIPQFTTDSPRRW